MRLERRRSLFSREIVGLDLKQDARLSRSEIVGLDLK